MNGDRRCIPSCSCSSTSSASVSSSSCTPAVRPLFPDSPRVKVNMLLALVFGSLFGMALALFRERIDQRLYGVDHLRHVLGAPVFGMLGRQGMALTKAKSGRLLAKW